MKKLDRALVDIAYDILYAKLSQKNSQPLSFIDLCQLVCKETKLTEDELAEIVSSFYTDLTQDGRFVIKNNNTWSLKEFEKYSDVHIDMNQAYIDDLDEDEQEEEIGEDILGDEDDEEDEETKISFDDEDDEDDQDKVIVKPVTENDED